MGSTASFHVCERGTISGKVGTYTNNDKTVGGGSLYESLLSISLELNLEVSKFSTHSFTRLSDNSFN